MIRIINMKQRIRKQFEELDLDNLSQMNKLLNEINSSDDNLLRQLFFVRGTMLLYKLSIFLGKVDFEKVQENFDLLLEWFQDINWPGTQNIILLIESNKTLIDISKIENAITIARKEEDIEWLGGIKYLLKEIDFYRDTVISKESMTCLESVDWVQ